MKEMMIDENAIKLKRLSYVLSFAAMHEDFEHEEENMLGISYIISDISKSVEAGAVRTNNIFEEKHKERLQRIG